MLSLDQDIPALPVLLPLWTGAVTVGLAAVSRAGRLTAARAATVLVRSCYLTTVLALTFFPLRVARGGDADPGRWLGQLNWLPVLTIDAYTFLLNVLMTVPLGMLAPLVVRVATASSAALTGVVVSGTIEGAQLLGNIVLGTSRVVDVNDVLANVAGATVGWLLLQHLRRDDQLDRVAGAMTLRPLAVTPERPPALARR